ncbi:MAG: zinc ribbon domain-containing protein [Oligoflexales bacterium]
MVIDRFFPSTKLCSECLTRHDIQLSQRFWTCTNCSLQHDRDINATLNLKMAASCAVSVCGEEDSDFSHMRKVKLSSLKQKFDFKSA